MSKYEQQVTIVINEKQACALSAALYLFLWSLRHQGSLSEPVEPDSTVGVATDIREQLLAIARGNKNQPNVSYTMVPKKEATYQMRYGFGGENLSAPYTIAEAARAVSPADRVMLRGLDVGSSYTDSLGTTWTRLT